jgi:dolichyl-phosphate beta-glucosyltransferase
MTTDSKSTPHVSQWLDKQPAGSAEVDISIVIPAYNEEWRLPPTLVDAIDYLESTQKKYEILVVDDGSTDSTVDVVKKFERIRPQIHLIRAPRNYGKGHAVKLGVLSAQGKAILFADADGSTPFRELHRLEKSLADGADLAIGSRALIANDTKVIAHTHRKFIGRFFNFLVNVLVLPSIADTQCGFKLFKKDVARFLFENQTSDGFSFDVELLLIARKAGLTVAEVPINWRNVAGSKVNLISDSIRMFLDIISFRFTHRRITHQDYLASVARHSPLSS